MFWLGIAPSHRPGLPVEVEGLLQTAEMGKVGEMDGEREIQIRAKC